MTGFEDNAILTHLSQLNSKETRGTSLITILLRQISSLCEFHLQISYAETFQLELSIWIGQGLRLPLVTKSIDADVSQW